MMCLVFLLYKLDASTSLIKGPHSRSSGEVDLNKTWMKKLITREASHGNPVEAVSGRVIRNHNIICISRLSCNLVVNNCVLAKFYISKHMIFVTWLISNTVNFNLKFMPIILDCMDLLFRFHTFRFRHILQETNSVANIITRLRCSTIQFCLALYPFYGDSILYV